jgi:hypothetical protein
VVGSGNRDHYRNDSCGLVEMNVRAIRLGKGYPMSALGGEFNRSTQHLLILPDGEVCDGRECTDMVYAEAED